MSNKLEVITLQAEGEANCYRMMRGGNWLASIRMNGELLVWDQEAILNAMLSSGKPAADPVPDIARQLVIQTFGDGLLAKIRQTVDLLQEAAAERDQLRAEVERLKDALETESMRLAACGVAALGYFEGCKDEYDSASLRDVLALRAKIAQQQVPDGWKLVPERMHLDSSVIETIQAHCGDGQEDAGFGPYSDGVLWIGECEEEDGSKTYGLHIATADYPEEGSSTLVEFAAAPSAPATVQGDGWIPVSERLPDVEQRLDKPCELEGKPLPPLNITSTVQCFDGTRVFADALDWFDGGQPMKGVTHWKPLDAAPAAIAAARKGE